MTIVPSPASCAVALRAELAKLRRAHLLVPALLVPLGFVGLKAAGFALRGRDGLGADLYSHAYFISIGQFFWERLLVPLLAIALCSWLVWLEGENGHWKVLLSQPVPRSAFYLAKMVTAGGIMGLLQVCWWLCHALFGLGLQLSGTETLWSALPHAGRLALALAPLISAQLWLAVHMESPFSSLGIGLAGNAAALILAGSAINAWHPWGLAQVVSKPDAALWTLWMAAAVTGAMAGAGMLFFARKDI